MAGELADDLGAYFNQLDTVDQAEAAALAQLCRHLLTVAYETPARIRRARRLRPSA
jgi:hypothetical protein